MAKESRSEARQRAAEQHRRAQEKARRQKITGIVAGVLVAAAVIGGLVLAATSGGKGGGDASKLPSDVARPAGVATDGAYITGKGNPVTVTVYEDLQCPACANFEKASGPVLEKLVADGKVKVERRFVTYQDRNSTDKYASRALNAVGCVLDSKPEVATGYLSALYEQQPPEGGPGLPDDTLTKIAEASGAPGIGSCVKDMKFEPWVKAMTNAGTKAAINATPTILVAGKKLQDPSPAGLQAAVQAAA